MAFYLYTIDEIETWQFLLIGATVCDVDSH